MCVCNSIPNCSTIYIFGARRSFSLCRLREFVSCKAHSLKNLLGLVARTLSLYPVLAPMPGFVSKTSADGTIYQRKSSRRVHRERKNTKGGEVRFKERSDCEKTSWCEALQRCGGTLETASKRELCKVPTKIREHIIYTRGGRGLQAQV